MSDHFTQWAWAGFAGGSLATEESGEIRKHLGEGCASCGPEFDFWHLLGATLRIDREPLPAGCLERALARGERLGRNRFRAEAAVGPRWAGLGRPRLAFDSMTVPSTAVRGLQVRRHCVYELEGDLPATVEVLVERAGQYLGWSVTGQIVSAAGKGWRDCRVQLAGAAEAWPGASEKAPRLSQSNEWGEFAFTTPEEGPWRLDFEGGERRWEIVPLLMP